MSQPSWSTCTGEVREGRSCWGCASLLCSSSAQLHWESLSRSREGQFWLHTLTSAISSAKQLHRTAGSDCPSHTPQSHCFLLKQPLPGFGTSQEVPSCSFSSTPHSMCCVQQEKLTCSCCAATASTACLCDKGGGIWKGLLRRWWSHCPWRCLKGWTGTECSGWAPRSQRPFQFK